MLFSQFISWVKDSVLQNIADDNFSETKLVDTCNFCLSYIYNTLNASGVFTYSAIEETINEVDSSKTFLTTYPIWWIIEDLDDTNFGNWCSSTNPTGVLAENWAKIKRKVFIPDSNGDYYSYNHTADWILWIKTSKNYGKITIRYKRMPNKYTIDDLTNSTLQLDLPYDLIGTLWNLMMWQLFPQSLLENGADLANHWRDHARDELNVYQKALWWTMGRITW